MRILIVAATAAEIAPVAARVKSAGGRHEIDVLNTGVGMVATAAWCSRKLAESRYDLALNFGVCGSFDPSFEPGTVVHVISDRIVELGAEDGDMFLSIAELDLLAENERPELVNPAPPANAALESLPLANGITVNTVHGNDRSIAAVVQRFRPQVESMEGAAFMYACLMYNVAFAQVRAVSNLVERRNRSVWRMKEAIAMLGETALAIIEHA